MNAIKCDRLLKDLLTKNVKMFLKYGQRYDKMRKSAAKWFWDTNAAAKSF